VSSFLSLFPFLIDGLLSVSSDPLVPLSNGFFSFAGVVFTGLFPNPENPPPPDGSLESSGYES